MTPRLLTLAGCLLSLAPVLRAAQDPEPAEVLIEARVSARLTDGFLIDAGADAGLEPGDIGYAFPAGRPRVVFEIRTVSRTGARADPSLSGALVEVGTRVEILIPATRAREGVALPWSATPEEWDTDLPLLAPAGSVAAADREQRLFGRFYSGLDVTSDRAGAGRDYLLGRVGADLRFENPMGRGGELELDAEVWHRSADLGGSTEDDTTQLRVNRLSWRVGGTRSEPRELQVGRFLQRGFSEFGLLDGVEYAHRTEAGNVWSASLGLMPLTDAELSSDDDVQAAVAFRHLALEPTAAEWGLGYQKTWHSGDPDRDLVVGDVRWRPDDRWSLFASTWVDLYSSGDELKDAGPELTDLRANANYRVSDSAGLNFTLSRTRFPELDRREFTLSPELANDQVGRLGLGGWANLGDGVRLSGRYDRWEDDDDEGGGGELRVGWRDGLYEGGEVSLAAFNTEGSFSSLTGVRLQANRMTERGFFDLTWELAEHSQDDFFGEQADLLQQALRGAWETRLGQWDLSLFGEDRFGDEQDSYSLGFILQRRF